MSETNNRTVKGIYRYPQLPDFISVRNYIYTYQGGKRCLLLRFFNGSPYEINEFEYTVTQIDAGGNVIKRSEIKQSGVCVAPGGMHIPGRGLIVDDGCADFKLSFRSARSGDYNFRVFDDRVEAFYPAPEKPFFENAKAKPVKKGVKEFSEKRRRIGKPRLAVFVAVTSVLLILAMNAAQLAYPYVEDYVKDFIEDVTDFGDGEGETNAATE